MRRPLAALAAAAALAAGCGGGGRSATAPREPVPAQPGSGYFVGTAPSGVGATVDLRGSDPTARALEAALLSDASPSRLPPAVGIASIVNGSTRAVRMPVFTAVLPSGALRPLVPARDALRGRGDGLARRAAALVGRRRAVVAPGGSAVDYVVLEGATPGRVAEVRMTAGLGAPVGLAPRPR